LIHSFSIFNFFVLLGCFQGLLLACVLLFNKKFRKRTNQALALSLLSTVCLGIAQILYDLNLKVTYPIVPYLPIKYTIISGIAIYYYIVFTIDNNHKYSKVDYLIILTYAATHDIYSNIKELVAVGFSFLVLMWAFRKLYQFPIERGDKLTVIEMDRLLWFRSNTFAIFIIWLGWALPQTYAILAGKTFWWLYYPTWIGMILMIFWLGYFVILKRDYFEVTPTNALAKKTEDHYKNLLALMQREKLYKNPNLNMDLLAKKTQLSSGYLSQIINHLVLA